MNEIEKAIEDFKQIRNINKEFEHQVFDADAMKHVDMAIAALEKQKPAIELLERAREEIQNCYGKETELTKDISEFLEDWEVKEK